MNVLNYSFLMSGQQCSHRSTPVGCSPGARGRGCYSFNKRLRPDSLVIVCVTFCLKHIFLLQIDHFSGPFWSSDRGEITLKLFPL